MTEQAYQLICTQGHVTDFGTPEPLEIPSEVAGYIRPCPQCGARANWRRKRPAAVVVRNRFNPNQR